MNFIFSCWKYLSVLEDKIRIPARPCNILYIINYNQSSPAVSE